MAGHAQMTDGGPAVGVRGIGHRYGKVVALDGIDLTIEPGSLTGLIGPDGVGKSTLLGLIAGVRRIQDGALEVLGGDMASMRFRRRVCSRIAYMPQGLGQNLYSGLSVAENVAFFGRLFGLSGDRLERRIALLLQATGLAPFADRHAGKLSGGMKQKLGLCCALIHEPDLLILDEPTTGVDPLSRQQFWQLLDAIRAASPSMTVLVATSYMDEAEAFDRLVMMDDGRILATGTPDELKAGCDATSIDDAYVALLPQERRRDHAPFEMPPRTASGDGPAVEAAGLTRRFGDFVAVEDIEFTIGRGEVFGFVGPNGSGKTTTMKMVTGLLAPSDGRVRMFGEPVASGAIGLRRRLGYMSQSFSLYAELTVRQNLALHARLFGVTGEEIETRTLAMAERFDLAEALDRRTDALPLGIRQRLSLAVAAIHKPELLILDEPTSGVDPIARDEFWRLIGELSREDGVTVFVSTHYLTEAMRCDRVALMNGGRMLACAPPEELVREKGAKTLRDAFIAYIVEDQARLGEAALSPDRLADMLRDDRSATPHRRMPMSAFDPRRLWAVARREAIEVARERFRLFAAFLVPLILTLVFGFGLSLEIEKLPFAVLDQDRTPASRTYVEHFTSSRYFEARAVVDNHAALERRFQRGDIRLAIEIPAGFGRRMRAERRAEVAVWLDGTMPYRAETAQGYAEALHAGFLADVAQRAGRTTAASIAPVQLTTRYWYNQNLISKYAFVPGLIACILMLTSAMITAAAVVREKELGSITNFHATPLTRFEYLWGKQLPYAIITLINCGVLAILTVVLFGVPFGGNVLALTLGAIGFAFAATAIGILVSTFTRTEVAAVLVAIILTMGPSFQYSGLLSPVSSLSGGGYAFGVGFPTSYFLNITVGSFTKDLGFGTLWPDILALAGFALGLSALAAPLLRKQSK